jgi:signal transduction histidine kinase
MRERAEARGGVLDVESQPGVGTVIRLRLGPASGGAVSEGK